jgi:response regulator of citrate/malate metabolism
MFKESVQEYKTRYIIAEETAEIELNERDLEVVRLRTEFDQYRENQPHFKETQREIDEREIDGLQTVEACEAWKVDVEKVLRSIEQKKVNSIFSLLQTMA